MIEPELMTEYSEEPARKARAQWAAASPEGSSEYLAHKGVSGHGVRYAPGRVLVPMRDLGGRLLGLQTIDDQGSKRFTEGVAKTGAFHLLGEVDDGTRLVGVAEGYATAATVHEVMGWPVAVAFDCGNLAPVARACWVRWPWAVPVLCADNDSRTEGNPGVTAATHAAGLLAAPVVIPATAAEDWAGDWNDLAAQAGRETVRAQIVAQLDGQRDALEARARTAAERVSRALGLLGGGS